MENFIPMTELLPPSMMAEIERWPEMERAERQGLVKRIMVTMATFDTVANIVAHVLKPGDTAEAQGREAQRVMLLLDDAVEVNFLADQTARINALLHHWGLAELIDNPDNAT